MGSNLFKLNRKLYNLCQNVEFYRSYNFIMKMINKDNLSDEILTELIIEMRNKFQTNINNIFYYKNIINHANNKLRDASGLIRLDSNIENFHFLLDIINTRILNNDNNIYPLTNHFLITYEDYINKTLKNNLNFDIDINKLIKVVLVNKDYKLLGNIMDSNYNKNISNQNINNISLFLKNKDYNYTTTTNNVIDLPSEVINLYNEIYPNQLVNENENNNIIYDPEFLLNSYDDDVIKKYIDSLNVNFINRTSLASPNYDILSAMINLNKLDFSLTIFNKSSYQPINKKLRSKVIEVNSYNMIEFAPRLNTNIRLSIQNKLYYLLYKIISADKIDSLHVNVLYDIIMEMQTYKLNNKDSNLCDLILDTILLKIATNKLLIYRTNKQKLDRDYLNYLSKDGALQLIEEIIGDYETTMEEVLDHEPDRWVKKGI